MMNRLFFIFILFIPFYCFSQNIDYLTGENRFLQSTSANNLFIDRNTGREELLDYINNYFEAYACASLLCKLKKDRTN